MPTAIQIEVLVDDKGSVQGVQRIVDSVNKVPGAGKQAFDKLNDSERKAHETAMLLNETLGVQLPAGLTKVIAKVPGVSTALSAAFKGTAIIAFVAALGDAAVHF